MYVSKTPTTIQGVFAGAIGAMYADGSCLSCSTPLPGTHPAFMGSVGEIQTVEAGVLRGYHVDGIARPVLARGGVTDDARSPTGLLVVIRDRRVWVGRSGHLRPVARGSQPAIDADATRVAFVHRRRLAVFDRATRRTRTLVRGSSPSWSPDGSRLAYIGPAHEVRVLSLASGRSYAVSHLRGRSVAWGATPPSTHAGCRAVPGAHTVATSPDAVAYLDGTRAMKTGLFGCQRSTGELRVLDTTPRPNEDDAEAIGSVATAGRFIAAAHSTVDEHYGGFSQTLNIYDVHTGRPERAIKSINVGCNDGYSCETGMDDVVVNDQGDAAAHTVEIGNPFVESILLTDPAGVQTADTATATSSNSANLANLRLSDRQLTWTHDGIPKSLVIP